MKSANGAEILLVEDNKYDAELILMSLNEVHLADRTLWLRNGKEALDFLTADGAYSGRDRLQTPRLILLDLKMPQIDGIEFLRKIRSGADTEHLFVVVFTASKQGRDVIETYELGVDYFIEKPMDFDNFSASVKEIAGVGFLRNKISQLPGKEIRGLRKKTERLNDAKKAKGYESASGFNSLVRHASGLIFIIDPQGNFSFVSTNCTAILGYDPGELQEENFLKLIHPEEKRFIAAKLGNLKELNSFETETYRLVDAKGRWRWFHSVVSDMRDESSVNGIVINSREVTELVQQKRALQWSNERYKIVSRVTQDLIYDWDLQTQQVIRDGDAMNRLFGFEPKYANQGVFWRKQIHPEDVKQVYKTIEESLCEKESNFYSLEYRFRRADGAYVYVSDNGTILRNNKGLAVRIVGATRDITEQKNKEVQKEVLLEISKYMSHPDANLKACLTNVLKKLVMFSDAVVGEAWISSPNHEYMNRIASYTIGEKAAFFITSAEITRDHQKEGLVGRILEQEKDLYWHHAGDCADFLRVNAAQKAGLRAGYGFPVVHHEQVIGLFFFFFEQDNNSVHLQRIFANFDKVIAPELQRKRTKDELDNFFRLSPDLMCIVSTNGAFLKVNPAFTRVLGYAEEELINHSCFEYMHPDDLAAARGGLKAIGEKADYLENRFITKVGTVRWFAWSFTKIGEEDIIVAVAKDITDQKSFQQQLLENTIQAQEKERNRIAQDLHDSIVQKLIGCAMKSENLTRYIEDGKKLEKELSRLSELIRKVAMDTRKISHNLLSAEMNEMSLEQLMEQLSRHLEYFTDIDFHLSTYLAPDIKIPNEVKVNLYRCIQELINNIIKHSGASKAFAVLENVAGMIYISVKDNGVGMPGNSLDKGIGISNVKSRVNAVGGKIGFRNLEAGGLEVSIEVPITNGKTLLEDKSMN